jgi:hypothetical protein
LFSEKYPGPQVLQVLACCNEKVPPVQDTHVLGWLAPVPDEYVPGLHAEQTDGRLAPVPVE